MNKNCIALFFLLLFSASATATYSLEFDWFRNINEKTIVLKFCGSESSGVNARYVLLDKTKTIVKSDGDIKTSGKCVERIVLAEKEEFVIAVTDYVSRTQKQYVIDLKEKPYPVSSQTGSGQLVGAEPSIPNKNVLYLLLTAIGLIVLVGAVIWFVGVKI